MFKFKEILKSDFRFEIYTFELLYSNLTNSNAYSNLESDLLYLIPFGRTLFMSRPMLVQFVCK